MIFEVRHDDAARRPQIFRRIFSVKTNRSFFKLVLEDRNFFARPKLACLIHEATQPFVFRRLKGKREVFSDPSKRSQLMPRAKVVRQVRQAAQSTTLGQKLPDGPPQHVQATAVQFLRRRSIVTPRRKGRQLHWLPPPCLARRQRLQRRRPAAPCRAAPPPGCASSESQRRSAPAAGGCRAARPCCARGRRGRRRPGAPAGSAGRRCRPRRCRRRCSGPRTPPLRLAASLPQRAGRMMHAQVQVLRGSRAALG